jgi:hypothetical protein
MTTKTKKSNHKKFQKKRPVYTVIDDRRFERIQRYRNLYLLAGATRTELDATIGATQGFLSTKIKAIEADKPAKIRSTMYDRICELVNLGGQLAVAGREKQLRKILSDYRINNPYMGLYPVNRLIDRAIGSRTQPLQESQIRAIMLDVNRRAGTPVEDKKVELWCRFRTINTQRATFNAFMEVFDKMEEEAAKNTPPAPVEECCSSTSAAIQPQLPLGFEEPVATPAASLRPLLSGNEDPILALDILNDLNKLSVGMAGVLASGGSPSSRDGLRLLLDAREVSHGAEVEDPEAVVNAVQAVISDRKLTYTECVAAMRDILKG